MAKKRGDRRSQDLSIPLIIGVIIGLIWAFSSYIIPIFYNGELLRNPTILQILTFPLISAVKLGFGFILVFIGGPLIAMAITIPTMILIYKIYNKFK